MTQTGKCDTCRQRKVKVSCPRGSGAPLRPQPPALVNTLHLGLQASNTSSAMSVDPNVAPAVKRIARVLIPTEKRRCS